MNKILLIAIVVLALIGYKFIESKNTSKLESEITALQLKNDSLKNENKLLDLKRDSLRVVLELKDEEIANLEKTDATLVEQVKILDKSLKNINSHYEKANSHSNNFSSKQISSYFADSLDLK